MAKLWKKLFCGLSKKFMYSEPVSPVPFPLICQFVEGPAGGPMWSRDHGQSVVSASEAIPQAQKPPQRGAYVHGSAWKVAALAAELNQNSLAKRGTQAVAAAESEEPVLQSSVVKLYAN